MFDYNSHFFVKNQFLLLYIANSFWLKWLLGLYRLPKEMRGLKVYKITPNSIHTIKVKITKNRKNRYENVGYFFSTPRFAEALAYNLSPFCYFKGLQSESFSWRFSFVGSVYLLFFGLLGNFVFSLPVAFMGTTSNYYSSSGDGRVYIRSNSWANARANATGTAVPGDRIYCGSSLDGSDYYLSRGFIPIDTSGIDDGSTISAATLNLYCDTTYTNGSPYVVLIQTTQSSATTLATADFDNITLNTPDEGATRIQSANSAAYDTFTLNATGIGWISKTGNTLLGVRSDYDVDNTLSDTGRSVGWFRSSEAGTDKDPYLSVTYSTTNIKSVNGLAKTSIKSVNGLAIASVKKIDGLA